MAVLVDAPTVCLLVVFECSLGIPLPIHRPLFLLPFLYNIEVIILGLVIHLGSFPEPIQFCVWFYLPEHFLLFFDVVLKFLSTLEKYALEIVVPNICLGKGLPDLLANLLQKIGV